ncbi:MAG: 3-keto-5-aminohexanoate cleavage protein [Anaerolineales bacterium]|nr:3-keto-5-aminohexanoate cleavage protein [Anaerolineales bacterium]
MNETNDMPYEWIKRIQPFPTIIDPEKETEEQLPVLDEPMVRTMDKKVIIEAAPTGWQPTRWWRDRGVMDLPPGATGGDTCIQEQVDSILECIEAGASCIHVHPRRPSDGLPAWHDAELLAEVLDPVFEQADFITTGHAFTYDLRIGQAVDFITGTRECLELGHGNKYMQASVIATYGSYDEGHYVFSHDSYVKGIEYFEKNGVKPLFSIEPYYFSQFNRLIFESGVAQDKPYLIALQMGKHGDNQIFADPWSYLQVVSNMGLVRSVFAEHEMTLGVHPGGRNWLPASVVALLNGAQYIRLGIEDIFFLWPHKNDIPKTASQTIKMIVDLCQILGREIATVDEAREIMGIKRTS